MSTAETTDAAALPPEPKTVEVEKGTTATENAPESQPEKGAAPSQSTQTPTAGDNNSPSPSNSHSEGEYSGSDAAEQREDDSSDKPTEETQPPLPNEPLPEDSDNAAPPLPNEPLPDNTSNTAPPLPNEPLPSDTNAPPLPNEPAPEPEDDGWEFHWNPNDSSYWFFNRFTGIWQKENPRVPTDGTATTTLNTTTTATTTTTYPTITPAAPGTALAPGETPISNPGSVAGGYNPAIHGDYDENAWYAQAARAAATSTTMTGYNGTGEEYATAAFFNRHTGQWQTPDQGAERHSDEAKARRQMRAFFDVDAAANMHDGRSLKAERAGIKPSRSELKAFKERRRQKKEEKRRAWLRD